MTPMERKGRMTLDADQVEHIAQEAVSALDGARQIAPFAPRFPGFEATNAYRVAAAVRRLRQERGERVVGRKIGFTNRAVWVDPPMWGFMYEGTVRDLAAGDPAVALAAFSEPRIEPEIVFGLAAAPTAAMDDRALLRCIGWVAHGFEIVQSIFPAWRFGASDAIAAFGLHGTLLVGPRVAPAAESWLADLATFEAELSCDGACADRGHARNVLGGPVPALRHLAEILSTDPNNPELAAGEAVTTGTLTRALPVRAGERWSSRLTGVALPEISVRFG